MKETVLRLSALVALALVSGSTLSAQPRMVGKFGTAQVGGRDVIVHVWVVVPPGLDENQAALAALRDQGARPFRGDEFSSTGLVWGQFSDSEPFNDFVTQNYNPANDPTGGGGETALFNTHFTWSDVPTSKFTFDYGGTTDRCPSLVRECEGKQEFDGNNDVAWLELKGCCTLGVTWFSTDVDEADMALNWKFSWSTDGVNDFDVETVFLHENGHVAGLGHSEVEQAVMYKYYIEPRRSLHVDDIEGITFLYPADATTGTITGKVTESDGVTAISGATVVVEGTSLSATTDSFGEYSIGQVPEGTYDVTASADGFVSKTETGVAVTADNTTGVNFALDKSPTDDTTPPVISNVSSQKSGKGGNFKITWNTDEPADSEVTFTCCGTFTNSELVTDHSMGFRGQKGVTYEYWVSSTDAAGNKATAGPFYHVN